jgi:dienelactone hydrolase
VLSSLDLQTLRPMFYSFMIISASLMPLNNLRNTSVLLNTAPLPSTFMEANQRRGHEEAVKLMQSLDRTATDKVLQAALDYLKQPGRKVATTGFSMGGHKSLKANLNDPEAMSATVFIYGAGFDKIDNKRLERLKSPVLAITGSEDTYAVQAAINFLSNMKEVKRTYEMLVYPGAGHGYAQPLFNEGTNYNPEAVHATWVLVDDFLESHLRR